MPNRATWYRFLLTRRPLRPPQASCWSKASRIGLWHQELAGEESPDNRAERARTHLGDVDGVEEWRELYDSSQANYRAARIDDGRLDAVAIIGPDHRLPPRDWLAASFRKDCLEESERMRLLRGTSPQGERNEGVIVCPCFSVGINTLRSAIDSQQLAMPEAIGRALNAGTNRGSCVPDLRRLIAGAQA